MDGWKGRGKGYQLYQIYALRGETRVRRQRNAIFDVWTGSRGLGIGEGKRYYRYYRKIRIPKINHREPRKCPSASDRYTL